MVKTSFYTDLAVALAKIGAIDCSKEHTLHSGQKSPVYVGGRELISYPFTLCDVGIALVGVLERLAFDLLVGVPMAGQPLAQSASREAIDRERCFPVIWVRETRKEYGKQKEIEGHFLPRQVCAVIDNTITSGDSALTFINFLQSRELVVRDVVVLVDREQGGKELLKQHGITLHSIFTLKGVLKLLLKKKAISQERYRLIMDYLNTPASVQANANTQMPLLAGPRSRSARGRSSHALGD